MRVGLGPLSIVVGIIFYRKVVVFTKRADIEAKTEALVMPIIEANNLELVDVEYVKEGSDYYLRVRSRIPRMRTSHCWTPIRRLCVRMLTIWFAME